MKRVDKHPDAQAWDDWIKSEKGLSCTSGTATGEYLKNRLWWAFNAGIEHAEKKHAAQDRTNTVVRRAIKNIDKQEQR